VSFEFLMPDAAVSDDRFTPIARSPMESSARAAGAQFEVRDGWSVAVSYGDENRERHALNETAVWGDVSHLGKIELQGDADDLKAIVAQCANGAELTLGTATEVDGTSWCLLTSTRILVICPTAELGELRRALTDAAANKANPVTVLDVSTVFAAMVIAGPAARETFARFCALDLRPALTPVGALRPGSIARQPGVLIHTDEDRFLILFGSGTGEYMWTVVADAAEHLGGAPAGIDLLGSRQTPAEPQPVLEASDA
jgi:heterotetrameric sarcosine oxidase gamma subunit